MPLHGIRKHRAMIPSYEFFRSVEWVWGIWFLSTILTAVWLWKAFRSWKIWDFKDLLRGEEGGTYTISYVLAFPPFMLLVCAVIQSTIILVVKMGTVYAAYAAARSSIVWLAADPPYRAKDRIQYAAVNAMAPFGSSSSMHAEWLGISDSGTRDSNAFDQAYRSYHPAGPAPEAYLARKYQCAVLKTEVSWSPYYPEENEDVTLTLTYRMPLYIAWFAKVLGTEDRFVPITTKVTLSFEGAHQAERQRQVSGFPMGIPYNSP